MPAFPGEFPTFPGSHPKKLAPGEGGPKWPFSPILLSPSPSLSIEGDLGCRNTRMGKSPAPLLPILEGDIGADADDASLTNPDAAKSTESAEFFQSDPHPAGPLPPHEAPPVKTHTGSCLRHTRPCFDGAEVGPGNPPPTPHRPLHWALVWSATSPPLLPTNPYQRAEGPNTPLGPPGCNPQKQFLFGEVTQGA